MSDILDCMALLAAAPIQVRWGNGPVVPLIAAPCLAPLARYDDLPLLEGL